MVNNLNNPKVPSIFIPVGLYDLQQETSKKQDKKLEKGDAVQVPLPVVRGVHLSSKSGIYLFVELTSFNVLLGSRHEYSFENLIVLNSSFKGKLNWSEIIPQKQEVWKSDSYAGGFHALKQGGTFLIIQNDQKDGEVWKGGTKDDIVWIRKINAKANIVDEFRLEAAKAPLAPRRCFVNMDGELILIANKPMGEVYIGYHAKKESTAVGRIKF